MSSLQERVAARRQLREQKRTFVLGVPGYEDIGLYARYKPLPFEDLHDIQARHADDEDGADAVLALRADMLARACVELLERTGGTDEKPEFRALGHGWRPDVIREHLGIALHSDATARDSLFAVFNGDTGGTDLVFHFREWDREASRAATDEVQEAKGESAAGSAPEAPSTSQPSLS